MNSLHPAEAVRRDQVGRATGIVLLLSIALIHLLDGVQQVHEHFYVFVLYVLLMAGTLVVSAILLRVDSRVAWSLVTLMAGLTFLAFVLSRTTGLPDFKDDIGNWTEGLGLASLFVEGCTVVLGAYKIVTTPSVRDGMNGLASAVVGQGDAESAA